jgi:hypothetical protein
VTFGGRQLRREVDARLRDARSAAEGVASFIPGMNTPDGSNGAGPPGAPKVRATATPATPASAPDAPTKAAAPRKAATKPTGARKTTKKAPAAVKKTAKRSTPASAADLPIREYDGLSASQVVSRLTGLSPEELQAVRAYEETSRGRRTVILAIDRLLA